MVVDLLEQLVQLWPQTSLDLQSLLAPPLRERPSVQELLSSPERPSSLVLPSLQQPSERAPSWQLPSSREQPF